MNIDWSKAPEWADAVIEGSGVLVWVPLTDGICVGETIKYGCSQAVDMLPPHEWKLVEVRPVEPWTGEGLPPVGTVCEVVSPGYSNDRFARFIGQTVTVIAHDVVDASPVAVFRMPVEGRVDEQDYHAMVAGCFRPCRTPEQIAAEERAANIEAMRADIEWKAPYLGPCPVELLYDAGYRKQPSP